MKPPTPSDPAATNAGMSAAERAALIGAIAATARGAGTVLPNPYVGCVLLSAAGEVVAQGYTQPVGGPHAEVVALAAAGDASRGATAVVTLEPCNHTGRTGPCSEALIAAGVARVVVAVRDPWPTAAGGIERLRVAGVDVLVLEPVDDDAAEVVRAAADANRVWLTAVRQQRPFVTFKAGMTLDGRVAAADGTSRWITSPESRADVHLLRSRVDTMMVGIGTVLADDPHLTVRDSNGRVVGPQPLRVVVDSCGRTPSTARVLDEHAETMVATAAEFGTAEFGTAEFGGAEFGAGQKVDLAALLTELYRRGQRHILLEGGPHLAAAMLDAGLINEMVLYVAPLALGAGRQVLAGGAVGTLAAAHRAELREVERIGPDVRLRYWLSN